MTATGWLRPAQGDRVGVVMRGGTFATFALGALSVTSVASAGDPTLAESLFREGKALMDSKNYAQACPKLGESYRQDPATGTLLAYAMCQEEAGKLASAWATFHSVIGRAEREGRRDRVDAAQRRADALEARLSRLTVEVPPEVAALPGLVVTRDGASLPAAAWGSATPTDPGDHVIEATAEGRTPFRQSVALAKEADEKVVRIPMLEPATPPSPAVAPSRTPGATPAPVPAASPTSPNARAAGPRPVAESSESSSNSLALVGIVVGSAGVVALGVGTAFGLRAKSLDDESRTAGCDPTTGKCLDDHGVELNRDARTAGHLSTVLFAAGGALVAGGVVLYLVGSAQNDVSASLSVSPLVAKGGGGLSLRARFE
jgi:hypothetical protein